MTHAQIGIWAALFAAHVGCMDLDLLDDLVPIDSGEGSTAGGTDGDADADTDGSGPPALDSEDVEAPAIAQTVCESAEIAVENGCAVQGFGSISLRFTTDEPAEIVATAPGGARAEVVSASWSTEHLVVAVGIGSSAAVELQTSIADVNGNSVVVSFPVASIDGPTVAITEVLADPLGEEPAQEFVEIANYGAAAFDISGWMIDDGGDFNGDTLPQGTMLDAGQVALLVPASFDPASTADPAPADDALVVFLEGTLGSAGLSNSEAETIELYDAYGALVSTYDGRLGLPAAGKSAARIRAEIPDGSKAAFGTAPIAPTTPGKTLFIP